MFFRISLALLACIFLALYLDYFQKVNGEKGKQPTTFSSSNREEEVLLLKSEQSQGNKTTEETLNLPLEVGPAATDWNVPKDYPSSVVSPNSNRPKTIRSENYMTLTPTGRKNRLGNPLYQLRLYVQGEFLASFDTVTGRAYTQNRNRHQAETEAPLPDGIYQVSHLVIPGTHPEVGDRFLPIEPLFPTGRTELGLHYDPSFEKDNGEDGTSGCIALTNRQELDHVLDYISQYKPHYLEVKIQ